MTIDEEITLKKMAVFLSFMRHGSMSTVAESMGLSTVSVHRALHTLESGLRCPLFRKEGRSLIPLETAFTFAAFAQRALQECEEGIRRTRMTAGFDGTQIKLGCAYSLTVRTIPQLIGALRGREIALDLDLKLGSTKELMAKLKADEIDAAIVITTQDEPDDHFVSQVLFKDSLFFAAPADSAYTGRQEIDLRELNNEKFVALHQDFLTTQATGALFKLAGFEPNIVMRAGNLFALANLVAEGVGFGLLPGRVSLFNTQVQLIPLAPPFSREQFVRLLIPRVREREPNLLALSVECRKLLAAGHIGAVHKAR